MRRTRGIKSVVALMAVLASAGAAAQVPPLPVFDAIQVQADCSFDPAEQTYRYEYHVTNPATNTIGIWTMHMVVAPDGYDIGTLVKPLGEWSSKVWQGGGIRRPANPSVAWWTSGGVSSPPSGALPGTTSGPFAFSAPRPPSIRECWVQPWLDPYFDAYLEATGDDEFPMDGPEGSIAIENSYIRKIPTLGPLGVPAGSFEHWDTLVSDVAKAGQLGWISDAALLSGIQSNLAGARQAAVAQDASATDAKLQAVIDAISASSPSQRTSEGYALVYYNAKYLQHGISWPCEPKLTAAPSSATRAVGETHAVTATLVNVATALPMANNTLYFQVTDGPNAGLNSETQTDANGKAVFSYIGTIVGTDAIIVHTPYGTIKQGGATAASKSKAAVSKASMGAAPAAISDCTAWDTTADAVHVTWEGGPDLTVPLFVPPMLISSPGNTFYITEKTRNTGNLPAGPSVTRYYIAESEPLDPSTALVAGQRSVPALAPGETSEVNLAPFTVPASLPAGTYYLDACADADSQVIETNEANNCASNRVRVVPAVAPTNRPPECARATAVPALLWPPNHKLQAVAITGVTDPDGDPVALTVTGITQDEPTNGLGDGDASPDGAGVGTASPQVRAERSGTGNGRVYRIAFSASDGKGGSCNGSVAVGVPHDKKDTPLDDGQNYDSTR